MATTTDRQYVIGIDCGTQSAKVVIYDTHGNWFAGSAHALAPMNRPKHGVAVHPGDDLWDSIVAATRLALRDFNGDPGAIVGIGLCPIRCCKAFLRADGSLAEPLMSWMDERAYQPYVPTDAAVRWATTSSGYLAHRLTGEFKDTAANNIVAQWPIDTDTWQWSTDAAVIERFGLKREMLFELQMPGDVIGPLTPDAATALGLPPGIPVVATANDKAVEMLSAGPLGSAAALVSLGTYITAMVPGTENHTQPTHFWTNFASIPNRYLYESSGVRRGMWTLSWFLDLLGPEITERATSLELSREQYIEREAALVPAGCDGLMTVLDWLATTDKPFRKGIMLGFDARHSRGHLYRSILEAIALTMKHHVDAMCGELGISLEEIVISGGGSNSPLMMQIFSDVFGIPASRVLAGGGAGLGAAMCAAAAIGVYPDIDTASAAMAGPRESFSPIPANTSIYQRMSDTVYHDIRQHTDALFERAYPIFH